jgi:site-specific DNA-cytosine methylase
MIRIADLFCGGGGETSGILQAASAAGLRLDLAAVNHWQVAIETHRLNFPQARAYCQDLATLNPLDVFGARNRVDLLWASPECTHHSTARGGRPRSELVEPFIVPYYSTGVPDRVSEPLASVTSKARFALVDGEPCRLDITFRMLQPHELAAAQGFPREHRFAGTKTDQVRQIGNAVPVGTAKALTAAALTA